MHFRVVRTHQRGIPWPKRDIMRAEGVVGELLTVDQPDDLMRRTTLAAKLCDLSGGVAAVELVPTLYDAGLVLVAPGGMMLRGFERIRLREGQWVEYAQGWWLRPM